MPAGSEAFRPTIASSIAVVSAIVSAVGEFLREFEPDFFFDDQTGHIESAARHVPAGHVASGVSNPKK